MIVCVYFCKIFWPRPLVIFRSKYFLTLICWMSPLCVTDIRVKLIIKHSRLQSPCFFFSLKHKRMRVGVTVWGVYVWSYQVLSYVDRTSHYCHLTHKEESITQSNCIFIFFVPACPQTETPACAEKELDFGLKFTMEIPHRHWHTLPIIAVVLLACCCDVGCRDTETFDCSALLLSLSLIRVPQLSTQTWVIFIQRAEIKHHNVPSPDLFTSSCYPSIPKSTS